MISKTLKHHQCIICFLINTALFLYAGTASAIDDIHVLSDGRWISASEDNGIVVYDKSLNPVATLKGSFEYVESRILSEHENKHLIVTNNKSQNSLDLYFLSENKFQLLSQQHAPNQLLDGFCLIKSSREKAIYVFLIKDNSPIEQRLIFDLDSQSARNIKVRELPLSHGISSCASHDMTEEIYVAEESIGVWRFSTRPEATLQRQAVAMLAPFGKLKSNIEDIHVTSDGTLLISQPTLQKIAVYQTNKNGNVRYIGKHLTETEILAAHWKNGKTLKVVTRGENAPLKQHEFKLKPNKLVDKNKFFVIQPQAETKPVEQFGDAADDPAIWVHPSSPENSLILGTDKQSGLAIYNLQGELQQFIASGRVNNVDVRDGFLLDNNTIAIAAASNRDHNSITLYGIFASDNAVTELTNIPTNLDEVYGLCMYASPKNNSHYVFINDKDGRYQQYLITQRDKHIHGELVREFKVIDQPEGCVADDMTGKLYVGVEDHGIWLTSAEPKKDTTLNQILTINEHIQDDVEGLALYKQAEQSYLIVSSQGNDSYAVLNAEAPYQYISSFQILANSALGIDGASETDGLEVTSANLGGEYSNGLLVVQDGRNVMPVEPQNFKLVPFSDIARQLNLVLSK